jgi:hypothetical protein
MHSAMPFFDRLIKFNAANRRPSGAWSCAAGDIAQTTGLKAPSPERRCGTGRDGWKDVGKRG